MRRNDGSRRKPDNIKEHSDHCPTTNKKTLENQGFNYTIVGLLGLEPRLF